MNAAWRRLRALVPIAGMAVAVGLAYIIIRPGAEPATRAPAPVLSSSPESFVLPRLAGGGAVRLEDFRGRPTVVSFFAAGCGPCREELPSFARIAGELKGRTSFIFVSSLETGDALSTAEALGFAAMPIARDVGGTRGSGLHDALAPGAGLPVTAFYSADGRLLAVTPGPLDEAALRARLHDLYAIGPAPSG